MKRITPTHFIEVFKSEKTGKVLQMEPLPIEHLKFLEKEQDRWKTLFIWKIAPKCALLYISCLLFSCSPVRWVAVPITTTVVNGKPGYTITGRPVMVNDTMAGKTGFIFKKVKP